MKNRTSARCHQTADPHPPTPAFLTLGSLVSGSSSSDPFPAACEGDHLPRQRVEPLRGRKSQGFVELPGLRSLPLAPHAVLQGLQRWLPGPGGSVWGQLGPPEPEAIPLLVPGGLPPPLSKSCDPEPSEDWQVGPWSQVQPAVHRPHSQASVRVCVSPGEPGETLPMSCPQLASTQGPNTVRGRLTQSTT